MNTTTNATTVTANMNASEKSAVISARILVLVAQGASLADAVNAVLGDGAYAKLAGDVYDALRAR